MKNPIKSSQEIAIIGMGCIFPKANGLKEYWRVLFNGEDAVTDIPENTHWSTADYFDPDPAVIDHVYCRRGGFLPAVTFDPLAYGMPPNNLDATDTSQLLGLQVAQMALEDAGYPPGHANLSDKIVNIILGVTGTQELVIPLGARLGHPMWKKALDDSGINGSKKEEIIQRLQGSYVEWQENSFPGLLGNVVAGRIANRLNLSGTNSVVDAACASSLSAIHTAVMELAAGRCDMSITGGVDSLNDIFMHMCFSKTGVLSHTSDARPFSADADGTVLGEGIGMLVLKRLEDAEKDNNRIYAVIKGVGTSSDGRTAGIYTPDAEGQKRALATAYKQAGIDPTTVGLIEAHGTGTRVGDKVEFKALRESFTHPDMKNFCALGSVKSMIGHTKAAAGAAGIIKAAMSLYHKVLPPTLKAGTPDPELDINTSPFYLNDTTRPWAGKTSFPRRSGVSAFGFGGSNFHVVLEEHVPEKSHVSWDGTVHIAAFSALDADELVGKIKAFKSDVTPELNSDSREKFQKIAWLTGQLRKAFSVKESFRLLMVIKSQDDPVQLADQAIDVVLDGNTVSGPVIFHDTGACTGKLAFLFPGQGSQYAHMGRDLISMFPEGLTALDHAGQAFAAEHDLAGPQDLIQSVFPLPEHLRDKKQADEQLRQTHIAQPAIGAVSMAMIRILERFGIRPDVACGHSFGELCALFSAGVIDEPSFFTLAAARGKYMAALGKKTEDCGSMLAVKAPIAEIERLIAKELPKLVLANRNSHDQGVLSGATPDIDRAATLCRRKKIRAVKLPVSAAFHSSYVAHAADPFRKRLDDISFSSPAIPVMSNTTGQPYPEDAPRVRDILGDHLIRPVHFVENIMAMAEQGVTTFIEVGPKTVLSGLVSSVLKSGNHSVFSLDASGSKKPGIEDLAKVLCAVASKGFAVDLTCWEDPVDKPAPKKMRIPLTGANIKPKNTCDLPISAPWEDPGSKPPKTNSSISNTTQKMNHAAHFSEKGSVMTSPIIPSSGAMELVYRGLEAMQDLQAQTARAHEKFLDTQAQAGHTLQMLLEQTRLYAGSPDKSGWPVESAKPAASVTKPVAPVPSVASVAVAQAQAGGIKVKVTPIKEDISSQDHADAAPRFQEIVFKIVSDLTGFPVEMLEPDMDIESDLGIDSIKKVEIVSELEKQIPSGNGLTTEMIGTVKTLKDICMAVSPANSSVVEKKSPVMPEVQESRKSREPSVSPSMTADKTPVSPDGDRLALLTQTISELTGFPVEMIEPSMDLESDLGIDSIKRVEILSRLEQALGKDVTLSSDDMAILKTLEQMVDYLDAHTARAAVLEPVAEKKTPVSAKPLDHDEKEAAPSALLRQIPVIKEYPTEQVRFYNGAKIEIADGHKVYITKESTGIAAAFKKAFKRLGISAEIVDILSAKSRSLKDAAGIVIIPDPHDNKHTAAEFLAAAFELAHHNGNHLMASGAQKGAFFATVSFMGGTFGFGDHPISGDPVYGGLAGLAKTAHLEWKDVLCRALDLTDDPRASICQADACVSLMMTHGSVEMGLDGDFCNIPQLVPREIISRKPELSRADVVVITGGAKGVTAACAIEIARQFSPVIVLIGRSKAPSAEPSWLAGLEDEARIKKEILTQMFKDQKIRPAELETAYRAIMSGRTIAGTLEQIRAAGSEVQYVSADIRDANEIDRVFNRIRDEYQNITAVIHGAGVLEDKLIVEKTPDQFANVFDTKVKGLMSLIQATKADSLKYFVMFSSVAARTGNVGQADYAMANEVLNKVAWKMARNHAECRVISINWGPWAGGMVTSSLAKEFARKGISLIDVKAGAAQLIMELGNARAGSVEVVIGASLTRDRQSRTPSFFSSVQQPVGRHATPVLNAHIINRQPVVPVALLMEFMAHAALKSNPGLVFSGMDDMRLLKGVVTGEENIILDIKTGKCRPGMGGYHVDCQVTSGTEHGKALTHAVGQAILSDRPAKAPTRSNAVSPAVLKSYPISIEQAYDTILFHGKDLQGIVSITGFSDQCIEVVTRCAPGLDQWLSSVHRDGWVMDPLMMDAAFQAAILWCHAETGQVCLPAYVAEFKQYIACPDLAGDVRISMTVTDHTRHKIKADFVFLNESNDVIAAIKGFEAISDPFLFEKFKPEPLFSKQQILAFAQGNPSAAFGEKYRVFDREREIARLPRPPYFFMDRVVRADPSQWEMAPGGWIETEYDIPETAWYFAANRTPRMPFCILLEIALQPCGWLAAYAGSALHSDQRLYFRNLGGKATFIKPITHRTGTVTVRSRLTDVSRAGGMIIQEFDMTVLEKGSPLYSGHTQFGFFSRKALSGQVGIRNSRMHRFELSPADLDQCQSHVFEDDAPLTPDDVSTGRNTGMPSKALRMIDSIDQMIQDKGGLFDKGFIRAVKQIDKNEWFFDAHFYQDPVCPGSLGVESFLQMLRFYALEKWQPDTDAWCFDMMPGHSHEWIYRGQILPAGKRVEITAHIKDINDDSCSITADGALSVDGTCIYEMTDFSVQMVPIRQKIATGQESSALKN